MYVINTYSGLANFISALDVFLLGSAILLVLLSGMESPII